MKFKNLFKGLNRAKAPQEQKSYILSISLDVTLCIIDHLDLADRFFLSHTCRRMKAIATCNWHEQMRQLSQDKLLKCLATLAYHMPHRWACGTCFTLHPTSTGDINNPRLRSEFSVSLSSRCRFHSEMFLRYSRTYLRFCMTGNREEFNDRLVALSRVDIPRDRTVWLVKHETVTNDQDPIHVEWVIDSNGKLVTKTGILWFVIQLCDHGYMVPRFPGWMFSQPRQYRIKLPLNLGTVPIPRIPRLRGRKWPVHMMCTDCEAHINGSFSSRSNRMRYQVQQDFGLNNNIRSDNTKYNLRLVNTR